MATATSSSHQGFMRPPVVRSQFDRAPEFATPAGDAVYDGLPEDTHDCIVVSAPPRPSVPVRDLEGTKLPLPSERLVQRPSQKPVDLSPATARTLPSRQTQPTIQHYNAFLSQEAAQSQALPRAVAQSHFVDHKWLSQSCGQWDPQTELFLRTLITSHGLSADSSKDPQDGRKVTSIYHEFYKTVDFKNWKPSQDDPNLWMLLTTKLLSVRAAMVKAGEVVQTPEGLRLRASDTSVDQPSMSTPPATPMPNAPSLPYMEVLESWDALNAQDQASLLRELLRTAKDQKLVKVDLKQLSEDIDTKEGGDQRLSRTPPADQSPTGIRGIIEDRIRELKLKRHLEKRTPEIEVDDSRPKRARVASPKSSTSG